MPTVEAAGNEEAVKITGDNGRQDGDIREKLHDDDVNVEQVEKKPELKKDKHKKKRRTREDMFEKAMDIIIEKVTTAQKKSNEMLTKLEEKQMKLDEQLMLMEDRRWREDKEREERHRREESFR